MINRIVDAVVSLMTILGAPGAGLGIALENIFPPIPSEAILPLAGFTASRGGFSVASAIVWTTIGSLVGALALYGFGAVWGLDRLRRIAERMPLFRASDVDKTVAWFDKHGTKAVFFGRFVPIFRSLISIPAGVQRMTLWRFLLFTGFGSLIWNSLFIAIGYQLGENWHLVEKYMDPISKVVLVLVAIALVVFAVLRIRDNRRQPQP